MTVEEWFEFLKQNKAKVAAGGADWHCWYDDKYLFSMDFEFANGLQAKFVQVAKFLEFQSALDEASYGDEDEILVLLDDGTYQFMERFHGTDNEEDMHYPNGWAAPVDQRGESIGNGIKEKLISELRKREGVFDA